MAGGGILALLGVLTLVPPGAAVAVTIGLIWGLGALALHGHRRHAGPP